MPGGDGFTSAQRHQVDKAIRDAETTCRYEFSVYVGTVDGDPRDFAERLHHGLVAPERSVLILLDPVGRALEVVTGSVVRRELEDHEVRLAVLEMQSLLAQGALADAIIRGVNMLAAQARRPPTLHG